MLTGATRPTSSLRFRRVCTARPAGTGRAIIERVNRESVVVLNNPEYKKVLADQAIDPIGSTPEELGQYAKREVDKWATSDIVAPVLLYGTMTTLIFAIATKSSVAR